MVEASGVGLKQPSGFLRERSMNRRGCLIRGGEKLDLGCAGSPRGSRYARLICRVGAAQGDLYKGKCAVGLKTDCSAARFFLLLQFFHFRPQPQFDDGIEIANRRDFGRLLLHRK